MQTTQTLAGRWKLDPAHTTVGFSAKHMMFTTVRGRFEEVEGGFTVDASNPVATRVEARIPAATITTGNEQRDAHLRSPDFFGVEAHPELTFVSRSIIGDPTEEGERFRLTGDLTIRGVTRQIELEAQFLGTGVNPWGQQVAGFTAEGKLDRREFGLNWNQALETGGILVSNEIRLHIEAQATPAE